MERELTDLWNFDHSITMYESDQQAASVLTESTGPFLQVIYSFNEDSQKFKILLL